MRTQQYEKVRCDTNSLTINIDSPLEAFDLLSQVSPEDRSFINETALDKTNILINKIYDVATNNNFWWDKPFADVTENQEIVLEWWNQRKKITIYVDKETIDFLKVWDTDMENKMEDGFINLADDLTDFWGWIHY